VANIASKTSTPGVVDRLTAITVGNVRISTRLAVSFSAVLALLALATWSGLYGLDTMYRAADNTIQHDVRLAQHASAIGRLVVNERRYEKDMILNLENPEFIGGYRKKWDEANQQLDKEVLAARELELSEKDAQALDAIHKAHGVYTAGMASVAGRIFDTLNTAQEVSAAMEEYKGAVEDLERASDELNARAMAKSGEAEATLRKTQVNTRIRQLILAGLSLALGVLFCLMITRSITRPLRRALDVSGAIASGRFDNEIESGSKDETGELLGSLGKMQAALLETELNAKGQLAMIGRMQAVAEYSPDGVLRIANDNFLKIFGVKSTDVVGKPHAQFVDDGTRASEAYRQFWLNLQRGNVEAGQFRRVGAGGSELWLQGMYSPIADGAGKVSKIVEYATDITEQKLRNADFEGQIAAIGKAQATVEFGIDGTVRSANENFLKIFGYSLDEIMGRNHGIFVDGASAASPEYRAFWQKLGRGEFDAGQYKRIGKGGRELWIQATYNPIFDASGRLLKVVEYATDVTGQVLLSQQLQTTVAETQEAVKVAAEGDLTRRIPMAGKSGDLESLCRGVNSLLDSTAELVSRVKAATGEVQQGAQEISKGNLNLSQRTEEQASNLEETASSMEEMTSTVKQTADNAGQANQLALAARQQAEQGGTVVGSAVKAMGGINEASKKIASIIGVIDEIAFQTNLLALNAAVEAARAGEQGRGFAVVATEVRSLAGRSAAAAKEIKALIQDTVVKVEQGSRLVDESGRTLDQIVTAVKRVTDIVGEIAAASREQSSGIEQVNKAVVRMDTTTQQNAALVEEAAAASQAIVEQAQALSSLVSRYNVGDGVASSRPLTDVGGPAVMPERRGKNRPWTDKAREA